MRLTRWPMFRRWFGSRSERAARDYLKRKGFRLVARNVSLKGGELDIVAMDGDTIVFVEVRSTESDDPQRPADSVDATKQRKLTHLAVAYLQQKRLLNRSARFDVVAVSWPAGQSRPTIVHHPSAFEAVGRFQLYS